MAITETTNLGLQKQDKGDLNWHLAINTSFDRLEARLTKSYAGDPNGNVAGDFVGQLCADTTNGGVWVCTTAGTQATAVWRRLTTTGGLTVGGDLSVSGSSTFTGSISANGGLVIPTGQVLRGPAAQAWLTNGTDSLDPIAHAARHRASGADPIPFLIYGVHETHINGSIEVRGANTYNAAGNPLISLTWDTTGRPSTSSAICIFQCTPGPISFPLSGDSYYSVVLDGNTVSWEEDSKPTSPERRVTMIRYITGVAPGSHVVEVRNRNDSDVVGGKQTHTNPYFMLIDLGIE